MSKVKNPNMFETYKKAISQYYVQQKLAKKLADKMETPTPADVKDHLLQYLEKDYDAQKDTKVLETFFGHHTDIIAYAKKVERTEASKFKSVIKFLKEETKNPKRKQVHLAALLIDFERPYEFGKDYTNVVNEPPTDDKDEKEHTDTAVGNGDPQGTSSGGTDTDTTGKVDKEKWWQKIVLSRSKAQGLFVFLLVPLAFGINSLSKDDVKGKQCMYWKGDRYIAVACDVQLNADVEKIALDTFVLNNFRMITKPDTITKNSIGKLWYLKYQKRFYYFTIRGKHPIFQKELHRLSSLIYKNEIESKKLSNTNKFDR